MKSTIGQIWLLAFSTKEFPYLYLTHPMLWWSSSTKGFSTYIWVNQCCRKKFLNKIASLLTLHSPTLYCRDDLHLKVVVPNSAKGLSIGGQFENFNQDRKVFGSLALKLSLFQSVFLSISLSFNQSVYLSLSINRLSVLYTYSLSITLSIYFSLFLPIYSSIYHFR